MSRRVELFNLLQGLISVYKPPGISLEHFRRRMANKLSNEFNKLPWENERIRTFIVPPSSMDSTPSISEAVDIVDNPLVIGKRFVPSDFLLYPINPLSEFASGVQVFGIGDTGAYDYADRLYQANYIKSYHLTGMFGRASSDGCVTGGTILQTTWRHITRSKLDQVLAVLESKARSASLLHAGLIPNTQKAFEALSRSHNSYAPLRAAIDPSERLLPTQIAPYWDRLSSGTTIIEGKPDPSSVKQMPTSLSAIRCVDFKPPFFTIELQLQNETDEFMSDLVANIGMFLRSAACLSKTRRLRHGPFMASNSLLLKYCLLSKAVADSFSQQLHFATNQSQLGDIVDESSSSSDQAHLDIFSNLYHCSRLCPPSTLSSEPLTNS